jgi:hypothetical protein
VRIFFWLVALLIAISTVFFLIAENPPVGLHSRVTPVAAIGLLVVLPYLLLLGQPGLQCSRMIGRLSKQKDSRSGDFVQSWRLRGLLRYLQDGSAAEYVYTIIVFLVITIIIFYFMGSFWADYYIHSRVTMISEQMYVSIRMIEFYAINTLMFLGYFLYNIFCPYDYQSDLDSRLRIWKKQAS